MREQVASRTAVLRLLVASLQNERIKMGHDLSEAEAAAVLQREAKQRRDSIAAFGQGHRPELAAAEEQELEIISAYLPAEMSNQELGALIDAVIKDVNATSIAEVGLVMGAVMKQVAGRADGNRVSELVRQRLSQ